MSITSVSGYKQDVIEVLNEAHAFMREREGNPIGLDAHLHANFWDNRAIAFVLWMFDKEEK